MPSPYQWKGIRWNKKQLAELERTRLAQQALHKVCPRCQAPINVRCVDRSGKAKKTTHAARWT